GGIDLQQLICAEKHWPDAGNEISCVRACLMDRRGILVTEAIVQTHIVFNLVLILPIQIPRVSSPVTHGCAVTEYRSVDEACGKVGEVDEIERAPRRAIEEALGIFTTQMIAP